MYGIEDKVLAIFFSLLILLIIFLIRVLVGTLLIPAGLFAVAWFVFTFFPLVALFSAPINSLAIAYIFLAVLVFAFSALPFDWKNALKSNKNKTLLPVKFNSSLLKRMLYFSSISSILLSIITMLINGVSIEQILLEPIKTSGQYAANRAANGLDYGLIGILCTLFTYLSPALGGLMIYDKHKKFIFIVCVAPSLLIMLTQSSKLALLVSLCFYTAGAISAKIHANMIKLPGTPAFLRIFFWGIALLMLTLISFFSRLGNFDLDNLENSLKPLIYSLVSYILGQIYAFSDFFSYATGFPSTSVFKNDFNSYGAYTLGSVFELLGIGKVFPPGMYEESAWYLDVFETNIFTFFRGLIYDFGLLGSLLFIFFFGIFSHSIFYRVLTKERSWLALAILMAIYVFILMGYLFSVFVARYVFLVVFSIWLILVLNERFEKKSS